MYNSYKIYISFVSSFYSNLQSDVNACGQRVTSVKPKIAEYVPCFLVIWQNSNSFLREFVMKNLNDERVIEIV